LTFERKVVKSTKHMPRPRELPSVAPGVDQTPAAHKARRVIVGFVDGQIMRVNLLPIVTPTPREVRQLQAEILDYEIEVEQCYGRDSLGTDILIMLGQGKLRGDFFEYKPGPVKTPSPEEVANLVRLLRATKVNLVASYSAGRNMGFKHVDQITPELWKQKQRQDAILTRTLGILGQADIARRVEANDYKADYLGYPTPMAVF
jgi:hypothetical protein